MMEDEKNCREHFKLLLDIRATLLTRHSVGMENTFQFVASLLAVLGILAGFGFTAYSYIESYVSFFLGETLVISAILYLIYKVRDNIVGDLVSTEAFLNQNLLKSNEIKSAILKKDQQNLKKLGDEYIENVMDAALPPKVNVAKELEESIKYSLFISGIGVILTLSSFFWCSLVSLVLVDSGR